MKFFNENFILQRQTEKIARFFEIGHGNPG